MGLWTKNDYHDTYVLCMWVDSYSRLDAAWHDLDDLDPSESLTINAAGMLVDENEEYITLAIGFSSCMDETKAMNVTRIPKCAIKKIKRLKFIL